MKAEEDDQHVVKGMEPLWPIPNVSLGKHIHDKLVESASDDRALINAVTAEYYTYKQLLQNTRALASSLTRQGYGKGSMFALCSENNLEFFIPVISVLYIGGQTVLINPNYTQHEMAHALNICKPIIIFCSKAVCKQMVQLQSKMKFVENVIVIDTQEPKFAGLDTLHAYVTEELRSNSNLEKFQTVDLNPATETAFMMFSSGTTGLPKAVMLTHTNMMGRFMYTIDPRIVQKDENEAALGVLPFFHGYGFYVALSSISKKMLVVVISKFEEALFLSTIEKYRISYLTLVPPLAILLAKSTLVDKYDLSSIKQIGCGAAPLSKKTEEILKKRLKVRTMRQGYGMTETTFGVVLMPVGVERFGSSGKITPYMLCKIRDPDTGKSLGPNKVGELCFKGPLVMKGYYQNEEATRISFTPDGWLLTGDLGYYDDEEYFYIVDRLKELIKYKGFQVAPAELEAVLLTNPKILDAGVIGLPDEEAGELPVAFVVKKPNSELTEKEVKNFVSAKVSAPKYLRGGVFFVSDIPKNASGKILRRKLKDLLQKHVSKL